MEPQGDWAHRLINRRTAIGLVGAGLTAVVAACGGSSTGNTATTAAVRNDTSGTTPQESPGPFPSDGTNENGAGAAADILHDPRVFRSDIRADLDGTNVQDGEPLSLEITVVDEAGTPLNGAAVYVWHCNKDGAFSGYRIPLSARDYSRNSFLRGAQTTDKDGAARFTTIIPGRFPGRAFHINVEVWEDKSLAKKVLTTQAASNDDAISQIYYEIGYSDPPAGRVLNAQDPDFSDGIDHQMITWSVAEDKVTAYFNVIV